MAQLQAAAHVSNATIRTPHPSVSPVLMNTYIHEVLIGLPSSLSWFLQFVVPPALLIGALASFIRDHKGKGTRVDKISTRAQR